MLYIDSVGTNHGLIRCRTEAKMTIRIQLVRTRYPHWGLYSGIHQYIKHLKRDEFAVCEHIVADGDDDFPIQNPSIRSWVHDAVQRRGMPWYKLSDLMAEIILLKARYFHPCNIIHYLDGEHSAQFLPMWSKVLGTARPKIMATYHQPAEVLSTLVREDVLRRLDCVTVVAPEQMSFLSDVLGLDNVHLVLHGVDTHYFRPSASPKEASKFKCLTVGHHQRDFKTLREVAKRLQHHDTIEFHIVSPRTPELRDLPNITVYQGIDDVALLKLYQQCHVLLLPLLRSTANNTILEAIACGLPVVSTYLPSVKVYLPGKEAILIKDNDPQQFVEAIMRLASASTYAQLMAREARKRAEELDWRIVAPRYGAIYSGLVQS
jgi:glycosyltransferase involved in cell wall biosynthesis